ncbi:MAG: hypothetical protein ACK5Q4_12895 [Phycisphaerae bacterium]
MYAIWMPHGGWARVVVTRVKQDRSRNRTILLYGVAPICASLDDLNALGHDDLIAQRVSVINFTAELAIRIGRWQHLSSLPGFSHAHWPVTCLSSDAPWQYVLMPPGDFPNYDLDRRVRVSIDVASQFPQSGLNTVMGTEWALEAAIEGGWKGRRPFKGGPILPMCLEPWDEVVKRFGLRL